MRAPLDISVVLSTRNRAESLAVTLECLARADREGLNVEVVVVDNGSSDNTRQVTESVSGRLPVQYLFEPKLGTYGKSNALNCAINVAGLGEIVAVLDDDMSPDLHWFKGVYDACKRWPDKDMFGGRTHIIWPTTNIPEWAHKSRLQGWIFSAADYGTKEEPLEAGRWFSGNHFWFRSKVLEGGRRFKDIWLTEPDFMLQLAEDGRIGMWAPDAVAGHRIQPRLLEETVARQLAIKVGRCYAAVRLDPYKKSVKQAVLFKRHPFLSRTFCLLNSVRWACCYGLARLRPSKADRFERTLIALERMNTYLELFRVANGMDEYRVFSRSRS